ncbi:MAG: lipocalin family protein, partial [Cyclobacteriaceae bacterium]|nr:lipocalin family protein [Cyclobacteriaceae bacterium]
QLLAPIQLFMKHLPFLATFLFMAVTGWTQSISGTWQLTDEQSCLQTDMEESDTERELRGKMSSNGFSTVAKMLKLKSDGTGEEGVYSAGKKKGSGVRQFRYRVNGNELQYVDKKSGMITERYTIVEMTEGSLKLQPAGRDCGLRTFSRAR